MLKKHSLVFAIIAALTFACGESADVKNAAGSARMAAQEAKPDGEKIYKQYCTTCHGLYGDMGASGAFNLQESTLSLEERIAVITNGRNAMTPFKSLLKDKEIRAVAKYTLQLGKQ